MIRVAARAHEYVVSSPAEEAKNSTDVIVSVVFPVSIWRHRRDRAGHRDGGVTVGRPMK